MKRTAQPRALTNKARQALTPNGDQRDLADGPRQFPAATVRDLIGIARLLYRTWSQHGITNDSRLPELVAIGKDLQESLRLAKTAQRPRQMRDAWERAELATRRLGYLIDAYTGVKPLIESAFPLVDQTVEPSERESKRMARQRR
jgi:hypothetical protein